MTELRFGSLRCLIEIVSDGPFVVTFSNWHPDGVEHQPFGASFIKKLGFNAAHIIAGKSDWFADDATALGQVIDAIATFPYYRSASVRIGYGSSMGAYAALRHRHMLGLDRLLVYCPQYSINGRDVGFERRWPDERGRHGDACTAVAVITAYDDVTLVYDSTIPADVSHVQLIDPHGRATRLALPFAGHPPMPFLAETDELAAMFLAVAEGGDATAVARRAWQARRHSPAYWNRVAEHWLAQPRLSSRIRKASWALYRALALKPDDPSLCRAIARLRAAS